MCSINADALNTINNSVNIFFKKYIYLGISFYAIFKIRHPMPMFRLAMHWTNPRCTNIVVSGVERVVFQLVSV